MTHQCRIVVKAKNFKGVRVDRCHDLFRVPSGMLDHIISLSRVEFPLSHLAWEDIADIRRHEGRVFLIADVDDRVVSIPRRSVSCILSESSRDKLVQERLTHMGPVLCNGICPFVDIVIEANLSRPAVRMRKPEDGTHRLVIVVA